MQSLKSIRLAEVDNFFKQSFEQKKTDSTIPEHPSRPFLYQTLCEHSGGLVGRAAKWALRCNTQLVYSTLLLLLFAGNILRIFAIWKNSQNLVPAKISTNIPGVTSIFKRSAAASLVHALLFFACLLLLSLSMLWWLLFLPLLMLLLFLLLLVVVLCCCCCCC